MKKFILNIVVLILLSVITLHSQSYLKIIDYDYSSYPRIRLSFFAYTENGELILNPEKSDYSLYDNETKIAFNDISCNIKDLDLRNSVVLSIDKAISLGDTSKFYLKLSQRILDSLSFYFSKKINEIAITSFDLKSYLNQDFTSDYNIISKAIYSINESNSSSIKVGIEYDILGSLSFAKNGVWKRSVIIATQGIADFDVQEVSEIARQDNIAIYFLYFGGKAPSKIIDLCKATGGFCFDDIKDTKDIVPLVKSLYYLINGSQPCQIEFDGNYDCKELHTIKLLDERSDYSDSFSFTIIDENKPTLEAQPPYLSYTSVPIGQSLTQTITIKAVNSEIVINSISTQNPLFQIVSGQINNPLKLTKGQTHTLAIRFTPIDSAIVFTKLVIESNACFGNEIYITGGFPNRPPKVKTIEVVNPKCGETLVVGDTIDIRWQGLLPKDIIQLEYSLDGGNKWFGLAKNIENLSYKWVVPNVETDNLLIRAIQLWPNNVGRTLNLEHRNSVNSAFFNGIGDRVISASDDSTVVIWNANNGEKIETFSFSNKVNYAVFDKTGKYIFVAVKDGYIYKYDLETKKLEQPFIHNNRSEVLNVEVCPHNQRFVSTSKDGVFYIWEINGGLIKSINYDGNDYALYATFDNAGEKILVTTQLGYAIFYDLNGNEIKRIDTKKIGQRSGYARNGAINNDGSLVAVVNDPDNAAFIHNYNSGNYLYSIQHKTDTQDTTRIFINYLSFFYNPDDNTEYLLSAGTDNSVRRWIARDGSIPKGMDGKDTLHIFREHTKPVMTSVFNFDGSRLLTASWDSTAKIWNLNQRDLQMDTTDCLISIGKAKIEAIPIDFGDVYINDVLVKTQTFIKNLKNFKFNIRNIEFYGPDSSDFYIISKFKTPFLINPNEQLNISIRFEPKSAGEKTIFAKIIIPNDTVIVRIKGRGIDYGLTSMRDIVDFGTIDVNDYKDTTLVAFVKNSSQNNIQIDSIYFDGPGDRYFKIIDAPKNSSTISPNEAFDLKLRYIPDQLGRRNGTLAIKHSGSSSPLLINLFGNATGELLDTLAIQVGDIFAESGKQVELPIKITNLSKSNKYLKLKKIRASLTFNSTMLEPLGAFVDDVINRYERTITFDMPFDGSIVENYHKIKFNVGLGNDTVSVFRIFNIYPIEDVKVKFISMDGSFKLVGYCSQGGVRLFDPISGNFSLFQNRPNPFVTTSIIEFELIERGRTSLKIYDINGELIKTVFDEYKQQGKYILNLNASDFAPGLYYYVLETPTQRFTRSMQVLR